ncbi:RagB/SusD family nutrient uptake outer membrane protein [uncultured Algoriphagus sp.]|uniref:RagB/SusD family nutrient uptake outer membrane protein n=1 Tax=uncultured Algoriphagus sp. TaxID=417365 RepID=UPI0030EF376C|tara:strand:+ start:109300 stop:110784 length:1485 start_codon:yes stop_codon:yes gene_type:complete
MKNIQTILGMMGLCLGLFSCELQEDVYSSITTDNFFQTAGDAETALIGAYDPMAGLYNAAVHATDFGTDQIYPRPVVARDTYTLFTYDQNYSSQKSFGRTFESPLQTWSSCYEGIERANWILEKVPGIAMDEGRKATILGEAYFLRGFYLWMLTKNFGEVVIKTSPSKSESDAYNPKSTTEEVYAQIFQDLDMAIANLPAYSTQSPEFGRPSKEAAMALSAKASLYSGNYQQALNMAEGVINSGYYRLLDDIIDVFDVSKETEARAENIWAYESVSTVPGRGTQVPSLYGPASSAGMEYGNSSYGSAFAYQSFYDSFDPSDKRRNLLATSFINRKGEVVPQELITPVTTDGVLVGKFKDPNSNGNGYAINLPIIRMADVYLIAAEAEAYLNGASSKAYGYINAVRNRAGLEDLIGGLGAEEFVDSVIQERSWEFFGEADRWYDLARTGKFLELIPQAVNSVYPVRNPQPKNRYFPIPLDEVNANPQLEQNPDWQ